MTDDFEFFDGSEFAQCWCEPENQHKDMDVVLAKSIAKRANALLRERGVRVYGEAQTNGEVWDWADDKCQDGTDTHTALLVGCQELKDG